MIGQKISHYRILQKLGGGGMGVVYEAEDLRLGRHVALKFIPDNLIGDRKFLDRFEREARAASLLNHPNICTIHDIEDNQGHPFIVMEKLDGQSLKERLHGSPLDTETLLDTAVQVADALAASHAKGILHRDIKPANIYLTPNGQVKVLDFGLAKLLKHGAPGVAEDTPADDSLTAVGVIPGTAVYMSPEQARSEELDARSDLFSFGVLLYEMATGKKPFHGKNIVTTLDSVMHQKPVSPRQLNPAIPAELEAIIGKAMEKDRQRRYASAEAMKVDLQRLRRDTDTALTKGGKPKSGAREISALRLVNSTFQTRSWKQNYLLLGMAGLLLAVLAAVGTWWYKHRLAPVGEIGQNTIAVLPLQNMNGDFSVDYLRFALADEVANVLTYTRLLDVRPSSVTRKYVDPDMDPRKAGRELRVSTLLTGHFLRQGNRLLITLEAIDTGSNKLLWQTNLNAAIKDLTGLQKQVAQEMRQGLLPVLGVADGYLDTGTQPQNPEGYDLYLHSIAVLHDPAPNKEAISVLEQATKLDPNYAPAWEALGQRYYYDATYSNGGEGVFQKSTAAYEKALALDPNRVFAASNLIVNRVERGELAKAYSSAQALVKQRPDSAEAHFAFGYVLRYAGMQEESAQQCDAALRLDPGNYHLRSCAFTFMELGKTQRAMDFVRLDLGSEWSNWVAPAILLREGKVAAARERARQMPPGPAYHREFLQACLQAPPPNMDKVTKGTEAAALAQPDPEAWYLEGSIMAFCGQNAAGLRLLKAAVAQNYCAYSALLADPLLAKLRKDQAFDAVLTAGHTCQNSVRNPQAP